MRLVRSSVKRRPLPWHLEPGSGSLPTPGWSDANSEGAQSLPLGSLNALAGCGVNFCFVLIAAGRFVAEPA